VIYVFLDCNHAWISVKKNHILHLACVVCLPLFWVWLLDLEFFGYWIWSFSRWILVRFPVFRGRNRFHSLLFFPRWRTRCTCSKFDFLHRSRGFGAGRVLFFCLQFDLSAPRGLSPARFSLPAQAQVHSQNLCDAQFSLGVSRSERPRVQITPLRFSFCRS
jgi:hypothetical protein